MIHIDTSFVSDDSSDDHNLTDQLSLDLSLDDDDHVGESFESSSHCDEDTTKEDLTLQSYVYEQDSCYDEKTLKIGLSELKTIDDAATLCHEYHGIIDQNVLPLIFLSPETIEKYVPIMIEEFLLSVEEIFSVDISDQKRIQMKTSMVSPLQLMWQTIYKGSSQQFINSILNAYFDGICCMFLAIGFSHDDPIPATGLINTIFNALDKWKYQRDNLIFHHEFVSQIIMKAMSLCLLTTVRVEALKSLIYASPVNNLQLPLDYLLGNISIAKESAAIINEKIKCLYRWDSRYIRSLELIESKTIEIENLLRDSNFHSNCPSPIQQIYYEKDSIPMLSSRIIFNYWK